ncbi:MAG: hypothetical protein AB7I04_04955 [Pseudomonadales bacterium]
MMRLPERHRVILLTAVLSFSSVAAADTGLLNSTLGRWLDTDVLPELGRTLGEHPRFKGETIKLVSLASGQPADRTSRLHQAVEAHLTQGLLRNSDVRLAWTDQPVSACGISLPVDYLLGVEIEREDSRYHRLNIRMIDVAESVWVSGVSHSWQGRLTATEAAALSQVVSTAPLGTVESPLPAASSREIARTMHEHLRCAHPEGLDGPAYLEPAQDPDLNRVVGSLTRELATSPLAALTADRDNARWVLSVSARETGAAARSGQVLELALMLTEAAGGVTQQVATVYMSGSGSSIGNQPPDTRIASRPPEPSTPAFTGLLSDMRLEAAADEGICDTRKARGNQCAEVSFDLYQEAYLFVLSSSDRQLVSNSCDARLVTATAGERRFRVRVPPSLSELPDAGVYAIAVSDREAAKALATHIRRGVCSRPMNREAGWLGELDVLLTAHPGTTEWRAIHLVHSPGGVERL